jgi:hypothetical protein
MLNGKVPCGCESRKEIMFTKGHAGLTEGAILGVCGLAVFLAWKYGRTHAQVG